MKTTKLVATLLATAAFVFVTAAQAVPTIRLYDGTTTVTVADQGAGDLNAVAGIVTFIGSIGQWIGNVTTGVGTPVLTGPHLDLNSVNISNITGASGFIDVLLSDVDFTLGAGAQIAQFLGAIGGTTQGMVTWSLYIDDGNTLFAPTTLIGSDSAVGPAFADVFSGPTLVDGTFSMTLAVRIVHGNAPGTITSFDFEGQLVPEPGTIMLIGAGLLAIVLIRRRRDA